MINIELLEELRMNQGISLETLSEKMGYTHSVYGKKLKKKKFTVDDVIKLCTIFGIEPNDLIKF